MRTRKHTLTYSDRKPWTPIRHRMVPHRAELYTYHDKDGVDWWSDGYATFRGDAPGYLRQACRAAGLPVGVPGQPLLFSYYLNIGFGARLDPPIAGYEVSSPISHDVVPVAGFAASGRELHVDARYLAYAEARFTGCTFWCIAAAAVAVRNQRALEIVGVVEGRQPPLRRRKVAT